MEDNILWFHTAFLLLMLIYVYIICIGCMHLTFIEERALSVMNTGEFLESQRHITYFQVQTFLCKREVFHFKRDDLFFI